MENRTEQYLKMLAFLDDMGADVGIHATARIASSIEDMDAQDLLHYQRVLEATIDNRHELMDREAMKDDLTEVIRERFARGGVRDKTSEASRFRARLASLDAAS